LSGHWSFILKNFIDGLDKRGGIILDLEKILLSYQNDKIAIYGLSTLTEVLLKQLEDYRVIGLLDGYRTSGALYGKPILSIEKAVQSNVRLIIIAARPESCKVIAKRIGTICTKHKISLLDSHGNDLCTPKKVIYNYSDISGISKKTFQHLINTHDVVSIDLFDTLLMRRTLFPTDVFEIVSLRLKQRGIKIEDFPRKRLEGERELGKNTVPTLLEIYTYILERYSIPNLCPEELSRMELEIDQDLIVPRKEVCALLQRACQQGKPVYIVSDTFYTKEQLVVLLESQGITWYTDIFASCDYRTNKTQQLFERLRERIPDKTCLHIGDSVDADVQGAERSNFSTCQLYSGLEIFEQTGYLGLWGEIQSLPSRIQAGMLVSNLLNSPFQFEEPDRKIHVNDAYDIGYLFFGPIITGFVIWFYQQIKKHGLKNIWFGARDGYLIKKLYDQLDQSTQSIYFLTSRFAAVRAGVENKEDIRYLESMCFSGSLQEQLWERFGIDVKKTGERSRLMDYAEEILNVAEVNRNNYLVYLKSLNIVEGDIAFFDFVARGTVQMYIGRLTDKHLKGFYFWQQDHAYMREKGLDIQTFYEVEESEIAHNYLVLETVLMAPRPTVVGFDVNGRACFAEETRTEKDLRCIQKVQDGITDYFQTYLKITPEWESTQEKKLEESILSLSEKIEIRDRDFLSLKDEDPFFQRSTSVLDLL